MIPSLTGVFKTGLSNEDTIARTIVWKKFIHTCAEYSLKAVEHCTGCFERQADCCREICRHVSSNNITVMEIIQNLPENEACLKFAPSPTRCCILCVKRTKKRIVPACISHCTAACTALGRIKNLSAVSWENPGPVLWVAE